ncbi:hypothetical protein Lesp02_19380 [Lentzea sp. NBRC 105346]|uniref:hypothetical protein n=1 Tax=Lentzea sp. NBRC 105346 TaxID=3032205 RepID=UPI0024A55B00|nr:hypothetical protein [Lentzea sp. NBRC 105346]GLZ29748.1 hypothetical protein Lesp02_19380 [Lentzea sp. NBRC 105346]
MLYVVLLLVLAALGLLVPALTTSNSLWAWSSVGASAAAAVVLFVDWWRRRSVPIVDQHAVADDQQVVRPPTADTPVSSGEPPEEDTDAADLLTVADLKDEVRVLDEHPRYHLADCSWLAGRPSLGLPVQEARQLGFTPCSVCAPDSTLARKFRAAH